MLWTVIGLVAFVLGVGIGMIVAGWMVLPPPPVIRTEAPKPVENRTESIIVTDFIDIGNTRIRPNCLGGLQLSARP